MLEQPEDHAVIPKKPYPAQRAKKAYDSVGQFPNTPEGDKAALSVYQLIDGLHQTSSRDIEGIFTSIRTIFQSFSISLDI